MTNKTEWRMVPVSTLDLNVIRSWPDGFQDRLQVVWKDVISFCPNVKLYDLQRVLAEFGFTMLVLEESDLKSQPAAPDKRDEIIRQQAEALRLAVEALKSIRKTRLEYMRMQDPSYEYYRYKNDKEVIAMDGVATKANEALSEIKPINIHKENKRDKVVKLAAKLLPSVDDTRQTQEAIWQVKTEALAANREDKP